MLTIFWSFLTFSITSTDYKAKKYLKDFFLNFTEAKNDEELNSFAVYARDRVNTQMYNYALSVALLHRPSTKHLLIPNFIECFPGKFLDSKSFREAREEANVVEEGNRRPIIIPRDFTASDLEPEHK